MAEIEQIKKTVPFVTCEITFGQFVWLLVSGVGIPDLNSGIHVNPFKQPIQINPVGSWHVSHCWTPAFDYHLIHGKVSCRIRILKKSWSALLCCVSHIIILPKFKCMMSVRDQTRWTFVTSFSPCCNCTSKFVHGPLISGRTIRAKYRRFRTICEQALDNSQQTHFLLLWIGGRQCMVLRLCIIVALFFASSEEIRKFSECGSFSVPPAEIRDSNMALPCLFHIVFEYNPNKHGQEMLSVLPNQRLSWVFSTVGQYPVSFQQVLYRPRTQTRIVLFPR